ncbi:MAG TPA: dTMP kinase [Vicinamibacterales bacterium]|nr:dTMP kinase [Vicinamibacterales bacterium]
MAGFLVAFEGLDQSGKQTQTELLREHLQSLGRTCALVSFPDYLSPIGSEIARGLHGERHFAPDVMQLLYVANRYERRPRLQDWLAEGRVVLCDRYIASSVAYGEAHGLDPDWLTDVQRLLPQPDVTILLDIAPETAVRRKAAGRDLFERDLPLLARVRDSYRRQASAGGWVLLDGERDRPEISADVIRAVAARLAPR